MYKTVYFDISGVCNGDCPYCVTGKKCVIGRNEEDIKARKFVDVSEFEKTIDHLLAEKAISVSESILNLYNWGEPFLHPNFNDILQVLTDRNLKYSLSTNCSILKEIPAHLLVNLVSITFSMSGFSQKSYDKIHGFDFETVKRNIITMVIVWRKLGYTGNFLIQMHVYQFNIFEINLMSAFANELKISLSVVYAFLNGYRLLQSYRDGTMTYDQMKKTKSELVTYFYDDIEPAIDESCSQFKFLTINEHCELLPCCGVERGLPLYSFGAVRDMNLEEIICAKRDAEYCKVCLASGFLSFGTEITKKQVGIQ